MKLLIASDPYSERVGHLGKWNRVEGFTVNTLGSPNSGGVYVVYWLLTEEDTPGQFIQDQNAEWRVNGEAVPCWMSQAFGREVWMRANRYTGSATGTLCRSPRIAFERKASDVHTKLAQHRSDPKAFVMPELAVVRGPGHEHLTVDQITARNVIADHYRQLETEAAKRYEAEVAAVHRERDAALAAVALGAPAGYEARQRDLDNRYRDAIRANRQAQADADQATRQEMRSKQKAKTLKPGKAGAQKVLELVTQLDARIAVANKGHELERQTRDGYAKAEWRNSTVALRKEFELGPRPLVPPVV